MDRNNGIVEVVGSIPSGSTKIPYIFQHVTEVYLKPTDALLFFLASFGQIRIASVGLPFSDRQLDQRRFFRLFADMDIVLPGDPRATGMT